ncbi:MAG: magnesium-translocating P-type ATPase [Armatimonadota bacterium]|nr:magnesium-translocating P-type ATPase [Armatimonadota bacterium]
MRESLYAIGREEGKTHRIALLMVYQASIPPAYWSLSPEEVIEALGSAPSGLSSTEARARLERFGRNSLGPQKRVTKWRILIGQFNSPVILILLFATGLSAVLKDWVDSLIILSIVFASALLGFVQEHGAQTAIEKLRARVTIKATVLRDGQPQAIPAEEIVPGDVVVLSAGSLVPADGILLEAKDLFVNQAALTGETFPVRKEPGTAPAQAGLADRTNTVFMGTSVHSGWARVLVVQTGVSTAFGQIAHRLTLRPPETEFERGIRRLGHLLTEIMLLLVLAIFAINVFFHRPVLDALLFSVALAVGLTPQLLPAIITVNLARGAQAMARQGVIVRRLASIENFGSMDVLCTDKTGTLTEGVVRLDGALDAEGRPSKDVFYLAFLNARLQAGLANPLDEAIVAHAQPEIGDVTKLDEIPYDFVRKRLSVVVQLGEECLLITKGALEGLLTICTHLRKGEKILPLDEERITGIRKRYTEWSMKGFRVLGLASKPVPKQQAYSQNDESGLTFEGFLLFFDPPKPGVKEVISDLARLGVQIVIISGDNKLVASHVAEAIGLDITGTLTGSELHQLADEALWQVARRTNLYAEVDPNQKERIIRALQKTGHVVGYMGDGINDAPALHTADVGISVENAVDVAKEAAEFVLLKKDLSVLHEGIVQGRRTFANTLKYVFMATSANFGNMFSMAGASFFVPFLPMLPKQILLINFLTDLPEMTIASDRVDEVFVERPHRWDIPFIRRFMLLFGPLSSVFDYITFGVLLWLLRETPDLFRTGWFVESILSAILAVLSLRTRGPLFHSRPSQALLVATAAVGLTTLALPYLPGARLLGFAPLPFPLMLGMGGIAAGYLVAAELVKRWFYQHLPVEATPSKP